MCARKLACLGLPACMFSFETLQLSKSSICFAFALPFVNHKSFQLSATELFSHSKWFAYYNTFNIIFFIHLSLFLFPFVSCFLYLFLLLHITFLSLSPTLPYNMYPYMLSLFNGQQGENSTFDAYNKKIIEMKRTTHTHSITCNFYHIQKCHHKKLMIAKKRGEKKEFIHTYVG